jgi:hypothetical protein
MQQIIPGVYTFIDLLAGRVYLIEDVDGLTIIDAGIPLLVISGIVWHIG